MKSSLHAIFSDTKQGNLAQSIIQKCVHCGFCNANCPTYRLTGEELDGPRGRIYQIKNLLEEGEASTNVQRHLDRCLTCRRCETTCPSSVQYSRLMDIAKHFLEPRLKRPLSARILRTLLLWLLPYNKRLYPFIRLGMFLRSAMPSCIAQHIPINEQTYGQYGQKKHSMPKNPIATVILPSGCVQSVAKPQINEETIQFLHKLGYRVVPTDTGCCGALAHHMSASKITNQQLKHNIQCWYEILMEAELNKHPTYIVITASGCGAMVKDYAYVMQTSNESEEWIQKAQIISDACVDLSELITPQYLQSHLQQNNVKEPCKIAYHPPCTLQHGQNNTGKVEALLKTVGYELLPFADSDQCCGSAGTYSLFQPKIAKQLRKNKLSYLNGTNPDIIVTANIGCQLFLEGGASTPIKHWIQLINQRI